MKWLVTFTWVGLTLAVACHSYPVFDDARSSYPTTYARRPQQKDRTPPPFVNVQGAFSIPSVDGFVQVLGLDKFFGGFGNFIGGLTGVGGSSGFNGDRRPTRTRPSNDDRIEEDEVEDEEEEMEEVRTRRPPIKSKNKSNQPIINLIFVTSPQSNQRKPQPQPYPQLRPQSNRPTIQVVPLPIRKKPASSYYPPTKKYTQNSYRSSFSDSQQSYPLYYYSYYPSNPYDSTVVYYLPA